MPLIKEFFEEIDRRWGEIPHVRHTLRVLGSGALMLQSRYERGTKDSDVLETHELIPDLKARLLQMAGPGSEMQLRFGLYLDVVRNGLPFLPQVPLWHPVSFFGSLRCFDVTVLDIVDVVVSKLKRFNPNDASDIEAMVERDLVPHAELIARFRAAVDFWSCDARASELPRYVANLNRVERDYFVVAESEIELPSWI